MCGSRGAVDRARSDAGSRSPVGGCGSAIRRASIGEGDQGKQLSGTATGFCFSEATITHPVDSQLLRLHRWRRPAGHREAVHRKPETRLSMARATTPTFIVELPLSATQADAREMGVRLELGRQLYNACLGDGSLAARDRSALLRCKRL